MADVADPPTVSVKSARSKATVSAKSTRKPSTAKTGKSTKSAKVNKSIAVPRVQKSKSAVDHPPYLVMISEAIEAINDRRGASNQAIHKSINTKYNLDAKLSRTHISNALNKGVGSGALIQVSGNGARGRFKTPKAAIDSSKKENPKSGSISTTTSGTMSSKSTKSATDTVSAKRSKKTSTVNKKTATKSKKSLTKSQKAPSKKTIKPKKA